MAKGEHRSVKKRGKTNKYNHKSWPIQGRFHGRVFIDSGVGNEPFDVFGETLHTVFPSITNRLLARAAHRNISCDNSAEAKTRRNRKTRAN